VPEPRLFSDLILIAFLSGVFAGIALALAVTLVLDSRKERHAE